MTLITLKMTNSCAICYEDLLSREEIISCYECSVSLCHDCYVEWIQTLVQ